MQSSSMLASPEASGTLPAVSFGKSLERRCGSCPALQACNTAASQNMDQRCCQQVLLLLPVEVVAAESV